MRNKTVDFAGKKIRVEEKRIGELEKIIADLFPESKGNIQKVDLGNYWSRLALSCFTKNFRLFSRK